MTADNLSGLTLGGCELKERIGAGGMATVYSAYQRSMHREVAVKIMRQTLSESDPTFYGRFVQEARTMATLEHLRILPVYDFGHEHGCVYLIMRRLKNSLADHLTQHRLSLPEAAHILEQIAEALDYAHLHRVIHRDVKPSNILLDEQGNAYLSDFGLAYLLSGYAHVTSQNAIMGTPTYLAPEQARGGSSTASTDIYSLGVVVFEMVCGVVPFQGETPSVVIYQHLSSKPPDPRASRPDLSPSAASVILKALDKSPDSRWPSAQRMSEAFQQATQPTAPIGEWDTDQVARKGVSISPVLIDSSPETDRISVVAANDPSKTNVLAAIGNKPKSSRWQLRVALLVAILLLTGLLYLYYVTQARPTDPAPLNATGEAALAKFDYAGAIQQFKQAIQIDSHYAPAYYNLGVAYEESGDLTNAHTAYESALQYDSRLLLARYRLAELLLDANAIDQGFSVVDLGVKILEQGDMQLNDAARQTLTFDLYATRGRAYWLRQASTADLDLAEADLNHALTAKDAVSYAAPAYYTLALIYDNRGQSDKAQQAWLNLLTSYDDSSARQRQWADQARQSVKLPQNQPYQPAATEPGR